jgi:hypothetical protein
VHAASIPEHWAHQQPDHPFLEDLNRRWTSARFATEVRRVAAGLAGHGIRAGGPANMMRLVYGAITMRGFLLGDFEAEVPAARP